METRTVTFSLVKKRRGGKNSMKIEIFRPLARVLSFAAAPQLRLWRRAPVRMLAQPRKKQPERTVQIFCSQCKSILYKYRKGGKGSLVKCFVERIAIDYTKQACQCPECGQEFARETMMKGKPAHKIISGKVFFKK